MTLPDRLEPEPTDLPREALLALVQRQGEQLAGLETELAETNRGVVALYAELDDRAEQLRHASELKSRFLSYVSHEFRTPLNSIAGLTSILLQRLDGPLNEEQERQIRFVATCANELSEMIDVLLDLAKVEAGRITVSPAWFEMVDLFSALRGMFKPILASADVELVFEEPPDVVPLYTDHQKLAQILRNFISNALKFTTEGSVSVSAAFEFDGGMVTFSVVDTGIGIPKEKQAELFQDFMQLDTLLQKPLRGSGLGLSLSKRLALLLGGSVALDSEPGVGSTFSVTIPTHLPGHEGAPFEPHARPFD
jgi:signal transduction histidine kinase